MRRARMRLGATALAALSFAVACLAQQTPPVGWVADASKSVYPNRPAAGRLYANDFRVDSAKIAPYHEWSGNIGDPPSKQEHVDGAVLTLQQGKETVPTEYYVLFLATKPGETIEGKTFIVPAGGLFKQTAKIMDKDQKG